MLLLLLRLLLLTLVSLLLFLLLKLVRFLSTCVLDQGSPGAAMKPWHETMACLAPEVAHYCM